MAPEEEYARWLRKGEYKPKPVLDRYFRTMLFLAVDQVYTERQFAVSPLGKLRESVLPLVARWGKQNKIPLEHWSTVRNRAGVDGRLVKIQNAVVNWAREFRLTVGEGLSESRRSPPDWVCNAAIRTVAAWVDSRGPRGKRVELLEDSQWATELTHLPYGEEQLQDLGCEIRIVDRGPNPLLESRAQFMARIRQSAKVIASEEWVAARERLVRRRLEPVQDRKKLENKHFTWFVLYQCAGWTWDDIAEAYDTDLNVETIRKGIASVATALNLTLRAGKRGRRKV